MDNKKKFIKLEYEKNSESIIIPLTIIAMAIIIVTAIFFTFVISK